jgi:ribonuclease E
VLWTNCEAAVEIARQLKLRNIGGVVIIDFIDMESRRDQLQLLEHFTQAVRDDAARPQIAQLTELGLVELTRKRQGQNIYELFGRACPSCGGLGHVAVLPGKDTLQPLATLTGLVRSAASARAEVLSPGTPEGGSGRRRRGGRGGRSGGELPETISAVDGFETLVSVEAPRATAASSTEPAPRRFDHELVAVPMDAEQELVFGWMGLNPALLLEQPPSGDNVVVRVVRPGVDADEVLEAARQQLAASGSRRRRGRGGRGGGSATSDSQPGEAPAMGAGDQHSVSAAAPAPVEITPLPELSEPETVVTVSVPTTISIAPPEVEVPARRGRTRSSVAVPAATTTAAVVDAPAVAVVELELDESGEPRRRRRRSSASS